jgi:hypothetical protein
MNLARINKSFVVSDFELSEGYYSHQTEIAYWRKFWPLHERIEQIYRDKGGIDTFNCVHCILDLDDIDLLIDFMNEYNASEDEYGNSIDYTIKSFGSAKQAIADGFAVHYWGWY